MLSTEDREEMNYYWNNAMCHEPHGVVYVKLPNECVMPAFLYALTKCSVGTIKFVVMMGWIMYPYLVSWLTSIEEINIHELNKFSAVLESHDRWYCRLLPNVGTTDFHDYRYAIQCTLINWANMGKNKNVSWFFDSQHGKTFEFIPAFANNLILQHNNAKSIMLFISSTNRLDTVEWLQLKCINVNLDTSIEELEYIYDLVLNKLSLEPSIKIPCRYLLPLIKQKPILARALMHFPNVIPPVYEFTNHCMYNSICIGDAMTVILCCWKQVSIKNLYSWGWLVAENIYCEYPSRITVKPTDCYMGMQVDPETTMKSVMLESWLDKPIFEGGISTLFAYIQTPTRVTDETMKWLLGRIKNTPFNNPMVFKLANQKSKLPGYGVLYNHIRYTLFSLLTDAFKTSLPMSSCDSYVIDTIINWLL